MAPVRRFVLRLLTHFRSTHAERDLRREIESHLQLLEDSFRAQGMGPAEAKHAARRAFGGVEQAKEHQRDARSFRWLTGWSMDLKLGARMLVKYPALTCVALIALSVAIGAGAAYMEFVSDLLHPTLPFRDGQRIVGIVNWDTASGTANRRALHDVARWRGELRTIVDLGAAAALQRNLITEDGRSEPVRGAEISAAAFRVAGTPPLAGRPLADDDEREGAPPVAVIGEDLWRSRFGGDRAILGRPIRLGREAYTVVGVMPRSFGFPINQVLWVPLRVSATEYARGQGPEVRVFGRLAPGVRVAEAQAELTAFAPRLAGDAPRGTPALRPVVKPYVASIWSTVEDGDIQRFVLYMANLLFLALLGICGANVATLVFARTVTREEEITVRTALGASRARIVSQLFAEALVLTSLAAVAGIGIASFAGRWGKERFIEAQRTTPPFWWSDALSAQTLIYVALLAIFAAAVVGIAPALKATGRRMQWRLGTAGASGPGMKLGGIWTVVIVGQVAVTIVFLMMVVSVGLTAAKSPYAAGNFAFRTDDFVTMQFELDRDNTASMATDAARAEYHARVSRTYLELERRLEREPGIAAVTHTTRLPGGGGEFIFEIEPSAHAGAVTPAGGRPQWVRSALVATDFFDTFEARLVAGRGFTIADAQLSRPVAIVDQTFVRTVLGGRDAVGIHVRQQPRGKDAAPGPWHEIVGVVSDLGIKAGKTFEDAMLYRPAVPSATPGGMDVVVHARGGNAASLPSTIARIAAEVDPTLRVYDVMSLTDYYAVETIAYGFFMRALAAVSAVALLLSTAGIYAMMSFTLSRRTREIGIRLALGAAPRRIVTAIFSRAFGQIGIGVLAGCVPGYLLVSQGAPEVARGGGSVLAIGATLAVAALISLVAAIACAVPARRALRIQPVEVLKEG